MKIKIERPYRNFIIIIHSSTQLLFGNRHIFFFSTFKIYEIKCNRIQLSIEFTFQKYELCPEFFFTIPSPLSINKILIYKKFSVKYLRNTQLKKSLRRNIQIRYHRLNILDSERSEGFFVFTFMFIRFSMLCYVG